MSRERLPNRHQCEQFELRHGNIVYGIGVGFYFDGANPRGRIGEIFIDAGKSGNDLRTTSHDLAIAVSKLLQKGETVEGLRSSFARSETGEPAGIIGAVLDHLALYDLDAKVAAE